MGVIGSDKGLIGRSDHKFSKNLKKKFFFFFSFFSDNDVIGHQTHVEALKGMVNGLYGLYNTHLVIRKRMEAIWSQQAALYDLH